MAVFAIFLHQIALDGRSEGNQQHACNFDFGNGFLVYNCYILYFPKGIIFAAKRAGTLTGAWRGGACRCRKKSNGSKPTGDALIGAAALAFAIGALFVKKAVMHSSSLAVTAYSHFFAALGSGGSGSVPMPLVSATIVLNSTVVGVLLFSSFMSTAVGALLWNMSIHQVGASTAALFQNASPVVGIFAVPLFLAKS